MGKSLLFSLSKLNKNSGKKRKLAIKPHIKPISCDAQIILPT